MREARARLEERRHAVDSERSQGALMKGLMKAKASGEIPGIFGRLGDLGAIDKEYDVAVSTACGPLDNVVVDTTKTAMAYAPGRRARFCAQVLSIPSLECACLLVGALLFYLPAEWGVEGKDE